MIADESQTTDRGAEEVNTNTCENEGAETKGDEDGSISAPLVLSQQTMVEIHRKLHSLEDQLRKLQVNGEGDG